MNRPPKVQDDRMSECRSFGSNYQPCSQSRKMSIGITIESFPKSKPENSKRNEAAVLVPENVKLSQGNSVVGGGNKKLDADITTNLERRLESSGKKNSSWVSPKSGYQKRPTPDGNHNPKQTMNLPGPSKLHNRCTKEKETSATCSVQSLANQILDSKYNEKKEKMPDKVICVENKKMDRTVQEPVPDKVAADIPHNNSRGCETLKSKLWEILGTVSSPDKHCINSQDLNVASKSLHPELKDDTHCNPVGAAKQNSDTIESDTQEPTLRRPVTRALARKKAPISKKSIKRKNSPTTRNEGRSGKDILSFQDGWPEGLSDGLPKSKIKKVVTQTYDAEKRRSFVLKANNAQNSKQSSGRANAISSTEKSTSRGNSMPFEPKDPDEDFCQAEPRRMEKSKDIDSPNLQQSAGRPGGLGHSYLNNKVLTDASTCSPSIEMNSPVRRSPLYSPTIHEVQDLDEHGVRERIINTKGSQSLKETGISARSPSTGMNTPARRSSLASPTILKVQDVDEHSSGDKILNTKGIQSLKGFLGKLNHYPADSRPEVDEDSEHSLSGSSSEEDSERSEDILDKRGYHEHTQIESPDIGTVEKPKSVSPLHKTLSNQKGIRIDKRSASASSKGDKARRELMRHLEQNQDDGLTRAIALFALALERLRGKVKSITQKKSAEILKSVADEIHLQLQNAETQIQSDMEKVAEHGRSKRKRLETQFQDLQGQLTVIYEKFKEEVNKQVRDYRDTLGGSEALKVELKGSMEKQRALHRKLLSQAEESIGNKLSDAQTRIDTVHNLGRGKMVQLKNILAEVLSDGVLG